MIAYTYARVYVRMFVCTRVCTYVIAAKVAQQLSVERYKVSTCLQSFHNSFVSERTIN